ncbi:hypothetical protein PoB_002762300 [Plakobranchus ocellatus]|uniref:Btz domain-containing protein n=1 Tax=Plakobranchus ocellatus TaxID=259542 RepID=A0AAV4A1U6_9GAST|nr:hypothetical protein PoB_002762300 [Plakobranchus ocellatus]
MPQDRSHRRKRSRSFSPVASKHKRSWQNEPDRRARGPQRSVSPRGGKKHSYKSSPSYSGRRDKPGSPLPRDLSPQHRKRPRSRSPDAGRRGPSPGQRPMRDMPAPRRDSRPNVSTVRTSSAGQQQRSLSPRANKKMSNERNKQDEYYSKHLPSPEPPYQSKKKPRLSSCSPPPPSKSASGKKRIGRSQSRTPPAPSPASRGSVKAPSSSNTTGGGDPLMQQRRVTSANKKKYSRLTLHKRFTGEDQGTFHLEENVTIAILRNPDAEPSEEVTVKKVFDSSLFKMIHKKTEGRKPIFDREEIKVWRHDENLADDPDFERRLVRVKSSTQTGKPASDSLSRMSPDVIRKAFGLQVGGKSRSRSPHREPQIRLDPRPDPRYESKYRQQMEREEKRRDSGDRRGGGGRSGSMERVDKDRRRHVGEDGRRGSGDAYDLRHALERRRSDREDGGGFRIEVRHDSYSNSVGSETFYRGEPRGRAGSPEFGRGQPSDGGDGGRNVVFGGNRDRYESVSPDRDGPRSWDMDRGRPYRGGRFRGKNRSRGIRGRRHEWSPDRREHIEDMRGRDRDRSLERRPHYTSSPPNLRGWRGNRGGRGRGRGRDFNSPYRAEIVSPAEIDDSFKYTQHDDRDISPKAYRGRGGRGRGRFQGRSFGSNNFRASRGGYRGRGFRGKSFGSLGGRDRRSAERGRDRSDRSADREWKHDMYDSLQTEEEQPHSTTLTA